jgi:TIR domain
MFNSSGKIFISHASKDKNFVDRLVSDLSAHGVPVWYDKLDVRLGDSIPGKINSGISEAQYFLIVLSPAAVKSKWVQEELNAALMRQVTSAGTFLIPVLIEDCDIPPLLGHRRFADFRAGYEAGLVELLEVFGRDAQAAELAGKHLIHPWPDLEVSDREFIYLHSTRFDKFFRMNCDLEWTANRTIDYIVSTLSLPWRTEIPELGMRWSFSYKLVYGEHSVPLRGTLKDAGIVVGSTVKISISGRYEDLYENEIGQMWEPGKMYDLTSLRMREIDLKKKIEERGRLTQERLRQIADSCFAHV